MLTTSEPASRVRTAGGGQTARLALVVGALGVVFGDIGTSPIYTVQTIFNPSDPHPVPINSGQRIRCRVVDLLVGDDHRDADLRHPRDARRQRRRGRHHGAHRPSRAAGAQQGSRTVAVLASLGIFGAALFAGDSMITPAISVLSAVEGLKVVEPGLQGWVVPITAVIIVALFAVQRWGTAAVGAPVRASHDRLVRGDRRLWGERHRRPSGHPEGAFPGICGEVHGGDFGIGVLLVGRRSCLRSPARRRSMPTWATSAGRRSPALGCSSSYPHLLSTTSGRVRW